ncbi:MAG: carbohydrate kinase family protein [Vicinamibacteria bacterium]|nr:carbohydrate kinase family protein [Vicinamibacteria bacterium]
MTRSGVLAGGLFIVDHTKIIDRYPEPEGMAEIGDRYVSNGGGPFNLLVDLARLGAGFPLEAVGRVGEDEDGEWVLARCRAHGIDAGRIRKTPAAPTSSTDVMTERQNGRRTFFHHRGANALLDIDDFDLSGSTARLMYLGYPMLLDRLDAHHAEQGTRGAELLRRARQAGFTTCVDFVTAPSERFSGVAPAILPHTDICLMNELEAERATGVTLRDGDRLAAERLDQAAHALLDLGVGSCVAIHAPEGAHVRATTGRTARIGSVLMPRERVAGTAGAGDAFAAGFLMVWHQGGAVEDAARAGAAAAAVCLLDATTSEGIRPLDECLAFAHENGSRPPP